jgi:hypothetical protein
MSYHTWSTDGFGFCVDDIETTPEKVVKLAAMNKTTLKDLRDYLDEVCEDGYKDEELEMDVFDDFEGNCGEMGLSVILREVIDEEIPIVWADDFDGVDYILYCPNYPWILQEKEKNLTKADIEDIFNKYIKILTDELIVIDFYSVENGG